MANTNIHELVSQQRKMKRQAGFYLNSGDVKGALQCARHASEIGREISAIQCTALDNALTAMDLAK